MSDGKPLAVNLLHTLDNMLKSYVETDHLDVLVNEVIANGLDEFRKNSMKDGRIEIKFERIDKDSGYIEFHNNAPPMTENQFIVKYHTLSESDKNVGAGIGFAGVGAKLFTASDQGGEIVTITGKGKNDFMASKMYRKDSDILYKTTKDFPLEEILDHKKHVHKYGTTYRARLTDFAFRQLKEKLVKKIQKWWNFALITKQFTITIEGRQVLPWEPKGDKYKRLFTWKKNKIPAICYVSKETIPEERRHIVLTVYGKRVENNLLENPIRIKGDYSNRIFCIADVSVLAKFLRLNKESFDKNWQTNDCRNKIKENFWKFLELQGLIKKESGEASHSTIVNELTKRLDILLNKKEFKDLNPFLNPRKREVPTLDPDGNIVVTEVPGESAGGGKGKGKGGKGRGHGTGTSYVQDDEGNDPGSMRERRSKGIHIIPAYNIKTHEEEAFVDLLQGGIVVDMVHPFFLQCANNLSLRDFNLNRILIEALIKFKNDEVTWDAKETLNHYRDLLHACWS